MFPSLSGSKQKNPYKFGATKESRLAALQWAAEQQRADLRKDINAKVELSRKPLRSSIGHSIQETNAYVQLFRSSEGDAAAADYLLRHYNPKKNCIDLVGLVPECARAISKYEKVLQVMEDEDREFEDKYKRKILQEKFSFVGNNDDSTSSSSMKRAPLHHQNNHHPTSRPRQQQHAPSQIGLRMIEEEKRDFEKKKKRLKMISKGTAKTPVRKDSKMN